jgi:hypothetical protein
VPIVREVVLIPGPADARATDDVRGLLGPFNEAIRFGLAKAATAGPFIKLAILVYPATYPDSPSAGGVAENVAMTLVKADLEAIAARTEAEARPMLAALVIEALDLFAARAPWDDASVRAVVRDAGAQRGAYTFDSDRLTARDRSSGHVYTTRYEFSRSGTRILALRRDSDGNELGRAAVMAGSSFGPDSLFDPATGRTFLHARSVVVKDGFLVYRNRERQLITQVALSAFDR